MRRVEPSSSAASTKKTEGTQDFMDKMRAMISKSLTDEQKEEYGRLAEKFHQSFDVSKQAPGDHNVKEIALEECLAYLIESLKSGLHPQHMTKAERGLVESHYGETWYEVFGYDREELVGATDGDGESILT
jgi:hypothetical protein